MDMRFRGPGLVLIFLCALGMSACVDSLRSQPPGPKWTIGFWYWGGGGAASPSASVVPDALFVHAGRIWKDNGQFGRTSRWHVSDELPASLPPAREYWLVFRKEEQGAPDAAAAPAFAERIVSLLAATRSRRLNVVGVQLDIDCPTGKLGEYAEFLRETRKSLPPGLSMSATGLLDWFRDGTSVGDVIRQIDEFVPQFYDVASADSSPDWRAVAAKIVAAQWAAKFNRFGKRYRIGISTFGRARLAAREEASSDGVSGISRLYGDLTPFDLAGNPAFSLQTSRSDANELILSYRALRAVHIGYTDFRPGDGAQFTLPTPEAVREAVDSARRMGGYCAGVVFFRWPSASETMVLSPDETMMAAGLAPGAPKPAGVVAVTGHCAAVSCFDLYLANAVPLAPRATTYRVHSSVAFEYILPQERVQLRMTDPSDLELRLPAYGGRSRLLLGRVVTAKPAEFGIEEER
jgi:Protein of unknown function (DUF3142)